MIAIGIDPGAYNPAHVALSTGPIRVKSEPFGQTDLLVPVFVEGLKARDYVSRQGMLTLGFYWGLHVGAYLDRGHQVFAIPIPVWRNEVLPRSQMLPKDILHKRVEIPDSVRDAGPDACDAYLIAKAGVSLQGKGFKLDLVTWLKPKPIRKRKKQVR